MSYTFIYQLNNSIYLYSALSLLKKLESLPSPTQLKKAYYSLGFITQTDTKKSYKNSYRKQIIETGFCYRF